jgi:hypothetical protein
MGERPGERKDPTLNIDGFSNAVRLTLREWIGVGLFTVALFVLTPLVWPRVEKFDLEPDYRMPYDLSNDYWLYDRYARLAASHYDTLLLGDSVIWGQYVKRPETLSHYLNEQAGAERFANLGLDGAHPAALAGLIEHYAKGVTGKIVLAQCNPLWLSSPRHDLQVEEEFRFNHPRLVWQFFPRIPCYREELSGRIGIVIEQHVPFDGWTNHLQQAYYDRSDIPSWTLEHPYTNPLEPFSHGLPPSDNLLRHQPISWTARGIKPQDYEWVDPETSVQWRAFRRAVEILQQRGNGVFVLLGPFNEHLLSAKSQPGYRRVKDAIGTWLRENKVPYLAPPALPSELYADASHPLAAGYAELARQVFTALPTPASTASRRPPESPGR